MASFPGGIRHSRIARVQAVLWGELSMVLAGCLMQGHGRKPAAVAQVPQDSVGPCPNGGWDPLPETQCAGLASSQCSQCPCCGLLAAAAQSSEGISGTPGCRGGCMIAEGMCGDSGLPWALRFQMGTCTSLSISCHVHGQPAVAST